MAFIVEDGTGRVDANALCSVSFANAYFADRGISAWTGADTVKQGAIVRATDYVCSRWGSKLAGQLQFPDTPQALCFPRLGIDADGAVPVGVQRAVAEYALVELSARLAPNPTQDASGLVVTAVKTKVGPIETERAFQPSTPSAARMYPKADSLMRPFLSTYASGGLVRA